MSFLSKMKLVMLAIFNELVPFIKKFLTEEAKVVLPIVAQVVASLATQSNMTWQEKQHTALEQVKDQLAVQCTNTAINVSTGFILDAIQVEVAKLRDGENKTLTGGKI